MEELLHYTGDAHTMRMRVELRRMGSSLQC